MVAPIWCWKCEFDRDGNKIKSGQIIDSGFHGEVIHIIRDANGHVTERVVEDPVIGTPFRHEIVEPFGKTQEFFYRDGDLQFVNTFRYDQYGHLVDWRTLNPDGSQEAHMLVNIDENGNNKKQWDWERTANWYFTTHTNV